MLRGICKQDRFFCRTPNPNRASGTKVLDRPESRPRRLCGIDTFLQVTEDRKADTLPNSHNDPTHVAVWWIEHACAKSEGTATFQRSARRLRSNDGNNHERAARV
jgi:hypothetical protein